MVFIEFFGVSVTDECRALFVGGAIVALFIIYHILHYTVMVEAINGAGKSFVENHSTGAFIDDKGRHDIYRMVVTGFSVWWVSLFYMMAMAVLSVHLSHGVKAMFQSIGLKNRAYDKTVKCVACAVAVFVFFGYSSIPAAVLLGILKLK